MSDITQNEAARRIHNFYYERLKWCGCGNPESALRLMRGVMEVIDWEHDKTSESWNVFYERYSEKLEQLICYKSKPEVSISYFYMLAAAGLLEHGGCLPGWLSDEGKALLQDFRDCKDDFKWDSLEQMGL